MIKYEEMKQKDISEDGDMDDVDEEVEIKNANYQSADKSIDEEFKADLSSSKNSENVLVTDDTDEQYSAQFDLRKSLLELDGIDQVAFFRECIAYLQNIVTLNQKRISAKNQIIMSEINEMIDLQIGLYNELIKDQDPGEDIIKNLEPNVLEHLVKGLIPVVALGENKVLFGTKAMNMKILSDKIMVQVGGGHILMEEHWRITAVSETIKINKLTKQGRKGDSKKSLTIQNVIINSL